MTETTTPMTSAKKRRTPAELRAYHQEQIKLQESRERAEVLRLVSDAHDTIMAAQALEASAAHRVPLNAAVVALKGVIVILTPK